MIVRRLAAAVAVLLAVGCTPPGLPDPLPPVSTGATSDPSPAPTSAAPGTSGVPAVPAALEIGFDQAPTGFNPHAIAEWSPAGRTVAELVLPWVSRVQPNGRVVLDTTLVSSAEVTSTDPFTVTYRLQTDASWSDGTPVTAEDFVYLAEQMRLQPGTVAPAGYRSIRSVTSKDAGKTVVVEFVEPVRDWLELFSPLLPSHLMRDSPGGWSQALATGLPVSAGPYRMTAFDDVTGQLDLVRNDKYWGPQPVPPAVVLRFGRAASLQEDFDRGGLAALVTTAHDLAGRPAVLVPSAATTDLVLNTAVGETSSVPFRQALARALDRVAVLGDEVPVDSLLSRPAGASVDPADALVHSPSAADTLWERAGWSRGAGVYRNRDGEVARLVLGVPADRPTAAAAAVVVQQQLAAQGIEVSLLTDTPGALLAGLEAETVSMAIVERPGPVSASLAAASVFGCAAPEDPIADDTTDGGPVAGNPSGYCRPVVDADLFEWVRTGIEPAALSRRLHHDLPVIPLGRPVWQVQVRPELRALLPSGPVPVGWSWTGPFAGLSSWTVPS